MNMVAQKITIEPVTRIEGHAKITIRMNEDNTVNHAYMHVNEFRGFEKFCEGRMVFEMPTITPRICGICPVSHHLAAAKAGDEVMGSPAPRPANLLRELMHMGQIIQSHGMHFFELAGPDLLLGFDSDPALRNVVGLLAKDPALTVKAIQLRKYGQEIIHTIAGRRIHPTFAIPGGVNKALHIEERDTILAGLDDSIATTQIGIKIIKDWAAANMADINKFAVLKSGYLSTVENNTLNLYHGQVRLVDQNGKQLECFDGRKYLDYINEHVEPWTYLKFPYYKKLGWPNGVYRVGPLGRMNAIDQIATPLANEEHKLWKKLNNGKPVENTLYFHYGRLIETLYALENVRVLCEDSDILSRDILNTRTDFKGEGVGFIEAPRGTLWHHYWAKPNGQLERVNLIVASGNNNWAMCEAVDSVAKAYYPGEVKEGWLNRIEAAIRAHDPCLSCSTHAVGQMPMIVEITDNDGNLLETVTRG
jgi:NAD-reducing hydrogenase large subunit